MKKVLLIGFTVLFAFLFPFNTMAAAPLAEADAAYDKGGLDNYKTAVDLYLKALQANPDDYETNWKCARAHRDYGDEAKSQTIDGWEDLCAEYGKKGMNYAKKAMDLAPDKPEGYYYYGLSVGVYADGVSVLTALSEGLKGKTQSGFEKVYALDKMYNDAGVILALGRFWSVLPWPMKDKKAALKYYREYQDTEFYKTSEAAPVYIAELLLDIGGSANKKEAKGLLEKAKNSEDKYYREEAERLLKENKL